MQMFLNKKNINRISRKSATIIPYQQIQTKQYSTISTFRSIKNNGNKILQTQKIQQNNVAIQMKQLLKYARHLTSRQNRIKRLSKPKINFKLEECMRNTNHQKLYKTTRQNKFMESRLKLSDLNKTISHSFHDPRNHSLYRTITHSLNDSFNKLTPHSLNKRQIQQLYEQNPIDLQNQEFKRRHQSFKHNYVNNEEQNEEIKNSIISNNLGKLSTQEILQVKQRQQKNKSFIMALIKTGQALSNQNMQSEQFRDLCTLVPKNNNQVSNNLNLNNENKQHEKSNNKFEKLNTSNFQILQKPILQKYKNLLQKLKQSQNKYQVDSYQQYDKNLSNKYVSKRLKIKNTKVLINCAEEWR